jgi:hypothetical protein
MGGLLEEARQSVPQPLETNFSVFAKCATKMDGANCFGAQPIVVNDPKWIRQR